MDTTHVLAHWQAFMEGGWEKLLEEDKDLVEAARRHALAHIPVHPKSIAVRELMDRVAEKTIRVGDLHVLAALLEMERHGHVECVAGWIFRPPPRVPRRGLCLEDAFYKFGIKEARLG